MPLSTKKDILETFMIMTGIAFVISCICGCASIAIVHSFLRWEFFAAPENTHYTEYNVPISIENSLFQQAIFNPIVIFIWVIPYLVMWVMFFYYWIKDYKEYGRLWV